MSVVKDIKESSGVILNIVIIALVGILLFQTILKKDADLKKYNEIIKNSKKQSIMLEKNIKALTLKISELDDRIVIQKKEIDKLSKKDSVVSINLKTYAEMMSKLDERLIILKKSQGDPVRRSDYDSLVLTLSTRLGTDVRHIYPNVILSGGQLRYENAFVLRAVKYKDMYDMAIKSAEVRKALVKEYKNLVEIHKKKSVEQLEVIAKLRNNTNTWKDAFSAQTHKYNGIRKKRRRDIFIAALLSLAVGLIIGK